MIILTWNKLFYVSVWQKGKQAVWSMNINSVCYGCESWVLVPTLVASRWCSVNLGWCLESKAFPIWFARYWVLKLWYLSRFFRVRKMKTYIALGKNIWSFDWLLTFHAMLCYSSPENQHAYVLKINAINPHYQSLIPLMDQRSNAFYSCQTRFASTSWFLSVDRIKSIWSKMHVF